MKKLFIVLLLFASPAAVSADEGKGTFTQHYEGSMFMVAENGKCCVEIIVKQEELKVGLNAMKIALHDGEDHAIENAVITIIPWMPDMGHGVKTKPVVTEEGKGLYKADNIEFSMSGLWELKIMIKKGDIEDRVVFTFPHIKSTKKFF